MKKNRFLQIAIIALCLLVGFSMSNPVLGYQRVDPWLAYESWRIDHQGPGGQGTGSWYRYSHHTKKPPKGNWGQFVCLGDGGTQCGIGGHATGWNIYGNWQPEGQYVEGPFDGERLYDADCNCYL